MDLVLFTRIFFDVSCIVFIIILIFCLKNKRVYAFGRVYSLSDNKSEFWQVVMGYVLFIFTFLFFRFNFLTVENF